jgi:large subunit ribosomal protein L23
MGELSPYEVIRRPVNTEKSRNITADNHYVFEVSRRANKTQIRDAIETIFKVNVVQVRVMNFAPKYGRWGRKHVKRSPAWKKAIVTVAQGQKLDIFEGV